MATIDIHDLTARRWGRSISADEIFLARQRRPAVGSGEALSRRTAPGHARHQARWQVSGPGKKLWKQKGTGRARYRLDPFALWRHGGTVHGPVPRSYDYAFPRKKLTGALRSALAAKVD